MNLKKLKLKKHVKRFFKEIKRCLKFFRPSIKGMIMVFIGIIITRYGIGVGYLTTNTIFGTLAYFFLAGSGLFIKKNSRLQKVHRIAVE